MITKYKSPSRTSGVQRKKQISPRRPASSPAIKKKTVYSSPVKQFSQGKLKVMVLGGLEEVGRNMTLIEYDGEIIIIDIGLQFPEEDMPGIDYIIPNISYLEGKEKQIKGVIITHGHMDHIGGIPHIIGKIGNPPMFMGKLTAGLVKKRCEEHRRCPKLHSFRHRQQSRQTSQRSYP